MSAPSPRPFERKACVLGGTGLVGGHIVRQLLEHPRYATVTLLVRRPSGLSHPQLIEHVVDFDLLATLGPLFEGHVLFSALGTTLKVAGSQAAQFRVDHDYQLEAARQAASRGVAHYVLVSSAGAHPQSVFFYSRMKGQLEQEVAELPFASCNILRPGILDGDRKESRRGEETALAVLRRTPSWLLPKSARPHPVATVARACIHADLKAQPGLHIIEAAEILATPASV